MKTKVKDDGRIHFFQTLKFKIMLLAEAFVIIAVVGCIACGRVADKPEVDKRAGAQQHAVADKVICKNDEL